jgi:hypothetical protein
MRTVIFETRDATFYFDASDGSSSLKYYAIEHKVSDAAKLLLLIESSSSESIKISFHYLRYFGPTEVGLMSSRGWGRVTDLKRPA